MPLETQTPTAAIDALGTLFPSSADDTQRTEQTAEALHTEVVQAQVFPRDTGALQGERTAIKAGDTITKEYPSGESASNTITKASNGKVSLITTAPQVRRLYFHPEYHFQTGENPNARGRWYADWLPGGKEADFAAKAFKEIYRRLTGI